MLMDIIRFLAPLGESIGFIWLLILLASVYLFWRRQWLGSFVTLLLAALIYVASGTPLPTVLLASMEKPYAVEDFKDIPFCDAVVVLGGGHRLSPHDVFGFELNDAGDRIVTGMELMRQRKGKVLVVGGKTVRVGDQKQDGGELLKKWFYAWQLPNAPILTLGGSPDTRAEALYVQKLVAQHHWQKVILVTSAFHMKRAEAVFKNLGISVAPVGCDFRAYKIPTPEDRISYIPDLERFVQMHLFLHETVGWWLYSWRGWTTDQTPPEPGPKKTL
jgi:uncharacterized SAM-binding protein YcdF (DUF218 family)